MNKIFKSLFSIACCLPIAFSQSTFGFSNSTIGYDYRLPYGTNEYCTDFYRVDKKSNNNYKISYLPHHIYIDPRTNKEISFDTFSYLVSKDSISPVNSKRSCRYPIKHEKGLFKNTISIKNYLANTKLIIDLKGKNKTITLKNLNKNIPSHLAIRVLGQIITDGDSFTIVDNNNHTICKSSIQGEKSDAKIIYLTCAFLAFAKEFMLDDYLVCLNRSQSCVSHTLSSTEYALKHTPNFSNAKITKYNRRNTI